MLKNINSVGVFHTRASSTKAIEGENFNLESNKDLTISSSDQNLNATKRISVAMNLVRETQTGTAQLSDDYNYVTTLS